MPPRKIIIIHKSIEKYLDKVYKEDFKKLYSRIIKLAENGTSIIEGRTYKIIKIKSKIKHSIIQIKIITEKYRIHTALTNNYLYLLHAFDKKSNKTHINDINISLERIKMITKL